MKTPFNKGPVEAPETPKFKIYQEKSRIDKEDQRLRRSGQKCTVHTVKK